MKLRPPGSPKSDTSSVPVRSGPLRHLAVLAAIAAGILSVEPLLVGPVSAAATAASAAPAAGTGTGPAWMDRVAADWVVAEPGRERREERQQLVLCTDDLEILQWARLEAMAGNAQVVDVNPGRAMAPADSTQGS